MKRIIMIICIASLFVGCARNYQAKSDTPMRDRYGKISVSPTAKKALNNELGKDPENEVICDRVTKTGSNIPMVTCKTIAEHKADKERSRKAIQRMRNNTNRNMSFDSENPNKYHAAGFSDF
jgi:PBP1b-binding outer membrane lipoprotein LpoB